MCEGAKAPYTIINEKISLTDIYRSNESDARADAHTTRAQIVRPPIYLQRISVILFYFFSLIDYLDYICKWVIIGTHSS